MAEDNKGIKKEEERPKTESKHKLAIYVDRIVMGVLGFMCVWFFTTMWELSKQVEALQSKIEDLQSKKDVDKAQWRTLQSVNSEIDDSKRESEVNSTIIKYYILPLLLKNQQGKVDLEKIDKAEIEEEEKKKKSLGKKIIEFVIPKKEESTPPPKKDPVISEEEKKKIEKTKKLLDKIEESKKEKPLDQYIQQQMKQTIQKEK